MLKLISCNVFQREACWCLARSPQIVDVEFLELGEHIHSQRLNQALQAKIDAVEASAKKYDAILLLYGLCGNASVGLQARRTRLVMPRAHDCCTILLGSRARFREHFEDNPSRPFSSVGYLERGNYYLRTDTGGQIAFGDPYAALVEQYGEEDAKFIWESMHPAAADAPEDHVVFIEHRETAHLGAADRFQAKAEQDGKPCVRLEGNLNLIRRLIDGEWDPADFLVIEPGQQTVGVYDWNEIVRAQPIPVSVTVTPVSGGG